MVLFPQQSRLLLVFAVVFFGLADALSLQYFPKFSKKLIEQSKEANKPSHQTCDDGNFKSKFDLIITWHTDSAQSPKSLVQRKVNVSTSSNVSTALDTRIENQREITYLLRGAEKNGLLEFVRKVFIVVNAKEVDEFGPPRDLDWNNPNLQLVRDTDIGVSESANGYLSKVASFHRIPGLGDWFLHMMDDVFPVNQFTVESIYDFANKRPFVRMGVDVYIIGWCNGGRASMCHGPWFASRCRLDELSKQYVSEFDHVRKVDREGETNAHEADARCLYDNWASAGGAFSSNGWATPKKDDAPDAFFQICHTNDPAVETRNCNPDDLKNTKSLFVNVQGTGVSDEYHRRRGVKAVNRTDSDESQNFSSHTGVLSYQSWFKETFPTPSRFEQK